MGVRLLGWSQGVSGSGGCEGQKHRKVGGRSQKILRTRQRSLAIKGTWKLLKGFGQEGQ